MEYHKIQSLFLRDDKNIIIPTAYTLPEFKYLENNLWRCEEKIDGTNIRLEIHKDEDGNLTCEYKGRTERANIPTHLNEKLHQLFDNIDWNEIFPNLENDSHITIYGEGYGMKIQGCGSRYLKNDVNFILFDVKIADWWLNRENCEEIAEKLGIAIVPLVGYMTIPEAIEYAKKGFKSSISEDKELNAEGLVLKNPLGLLNRAGKRLITKVKTCDFNKYFNAYGTGEVKQNINPYLQK